MQHLWIIWLCSLQQFTKRLKEVLQGRQLTTRPFLITYVESALGLMNLRDIFKKTIDLQLKEQLYILDGVVFGSDDFCADIGLFIICYLQIPDWVLFLLLWKMIPFWFLLSSIATWCTFRDIVIASDPIYTFTSLTLRMQL